MRLSLAAAAALLCATALSTGVVHGANDARRPACRSDILPPP